MVDQKINLSDELIKLKDSALIAQFLSVFFHQIELYMAVQVANGALEDIVRNNYRQIAAALRAHASVLEEYGTH